MILTNWLYPLIICLFGKAAFGNTGHHYDSLERIDEFIPEEPEEVETPSPVVLFVKVISDYLGMIAKDFDPVLRCTAQVLRSSRQSDYESSPLYKWHADPKTSAFIGVLFMVLGLLSMMLVGFKSYTFPFSLACGHIFGTASWIIGHRYKAPLEFAIYGGLVGFLCLGPLVLFLWHIVEALVGGLLAVMLGNVFSSSPLVNFSGLVVNTAYFLTGVALMSKFARAVKIAILTLFGGTMTAWGFDTFCPVGIRQVIIGSVYSDQRAINAMFLEPMVFLNAKGAWSFILGLTSIAVLSHYYVHPSNFVEPKSLD
jgi:hypothetical protein